MSKKDKAIDVLRGIVARESGIPLDEVTKETIIGDGNRISSVMLENILRCIKTFFNYQVSYPTVMTINKLASIVHARVH
ncbi:MAG: hypothetical protein WCS86_00705 [Candidatus Paceibacterota bacterium]